MRNCRFPTGHCRHCTAMYMFVFFSLHTLLAVFKVPCLQCQVTCSPRPPTLSQCHVDLHVWSYLDVVLYSKFHRNLFRGFWARGLKFGHSHYFGYWLLQQYKHQLDHFAFLVFCNPLQWQAIKRTYGDKWHVLTGWMSLPSPNKQCETYWWEQVQTAVNNEPTTHKVNTSPWTCGPHDLQWTADVSSSSVQLTPLSCVSSRAQSGAASAVHAARWCVLGCSLSACTTVEQSD